MVSTNLFKGTGNILVIKLRHIGDVLLTVPAIRALKETFPSASVSALVNPGTEDMLTLNPLLEEVICYERHAKGSPMGRKTGGELKFIRKLRGKNFDMTVDLTGGDRPAIVGFLSGAKYRLGYMPKEGFIGKRFLYTHLAKRPLVPTHTVLYDLGLLRQFGIDTRDLTVDIYASPEDDIFVECLLKEKGYKKEPLVHVHPTSRWLFKCWTDEGMARVMDELGNSGYRVVVTSGPDERELKKVASVIGLMKTRPIDLSGRLQLKHLASLSRRAAFFFGVDSAPMHIAAAAGCRVVGIFGPSGAFHWGPWENTEAARLVQSAEENASINSPYPGRNGIQTFGRNTVIQAGWDCIPCGKDGCKGTKKSDCLDKIDPETVLKVLRDIGV